MQASDGYRTTARIDRFFEETRPRSLCVVVDFDIVRARLSELRRALPEVEIYYAVKANPAPEVVGALAALGANFDLASPGEIDICRGLNIAPERLSFGNTIKRESTIAGAVAAPYMPFFYPRIILPGVRRSFDC